MEDVQSSTVLDRNWSGLLIALLEGGPSNLADLDHVVKNFSTRKAALDKMSEAGLVTKEYVEKPRLSFQYSLT